MATEIRLPEPTQTLGDAWYAAPVRLSGAKPGRVPSRIVVLGAVLTVTIAAAGRGGMDLARLRQIIATGSMPRSIDPARGLLLILHHGSAVGGDPRAGADGKVRVAERLCGRRLDTELVALRRTLATRLDLPADRGGVTCSELSCRFVAAPAPPGQARAGELVFRPGSAGGLLLDSVVMREPEPAPAHEAAATRWIEERKRALGGGRCSGP